MRKIILLIVWAVFVIAAAQLVLVVLFDPVCPAVPVTSVGYLDNGSIQIARQDGGIEVWDFSAENASLSYNFARKLNNLSGVAFAPNGNVALTTNWDGTMQLWDTHTGAMLHALFADVNDVTSAIFSPDSKTVLSGSIDGAVRLWDAQTGSLLHTFSGHTIRVTSLAFSPQQDKILSGTL